MPELSEIFSQARELHPAVDFEDKGQEQTRNQIFEQVKKGWPALYQSLVNFGFGTARSRYENDVTAERRLREAAEAERDGLKEQLNNKQQPEIKQLNEQWQSKLEQETGTLKTQLEQARAEARAILLERDQETLRRELVDLGVPKANARGIAYDPKLLPDRGEYDEKKTLTVYQAGQKIPLMPGSGQTVLQALAHELVETPEVKEILISTGDAGGGITSGRSNGPADGDKSFYADIRKNAEAERQSQQPKVSLKERMANRR